jgi:tRNA threonylcarbamoyl adenosine modification protein (Sua5/YciO/YrdC/YwlC family)
MDVSLDRAAELITAGMVGVLPTDTVMGLVCSAKDRSAVTRLYIVKGRERKPGTLIGAGIDQFVALGVKARYLRAVEGYWPNAISVVVPYADVDLTYLHQGKGTLAVRVPQNDTIQRLLRKTGPLVTTSANMPGEPLATSLTEAKAYFGESVDFYVEPIPGLVQQPSTIIRIVDDSVEVLREGAVKINKETGEIQ